MSAHRPNLHNIGGSIPVASVMGAGLRATGRTILLGTRGPRPSNKPIGSASAVEGLLSEQEYWEESNMRRTVAFLFLLTLATIALPAYAGVGNNPNAEVIANIACEDGTTLALVIATGQAGHQPSGQLAGVATSIFVLGGPNGNVLFPLFDRPGVGLDSQTTWCWWFDQAQGAWIGADILIHPNFR